MSLYVLEPLPTPPALPEIHPPLFLPSHTNRDSNITTVSHGLTGVYSNQKLIEEELKLRTKYNIYDYISDLFYEEFMIKCM